MNNASGPAGEDFAAEYMKAQGYEILRRNYHSRFGEIDIIARSSRYLVFTEVKTRESGSLVNPLEAVTPAKQKKIVRTALCYLQAFPADLQPRFDVAAVLTERGKPVSVSYLPDAFSCGGFF